jgi:lysophospholipase L1-like esterase
VFNNIYPIDVENPLTDYSWKWLHKIIDYCDEKGIELVLVNVPMPDGQMQADLYYDEYTQYIRNVAQEYGLKYYDFNLTKKGVLTMERSDYDDNSHLNGQGADKFSECVSKILSGELDESAFYDTFAEKLANNPDGTAK